VDGLILRITYDFLNNLDRRGLKVSNIRVKLISKNTKLRGTTYLSFSNLSSFFETYKTILSDRRYLCSAGDFPIIENLSLNNVNLKFKNSYNWYNITQSRKLDTKIQYDNSRNEIYDREIQRYLDLMYKSIDEYTVNVNNGIKVRLNSYVDPCYVDAGYVSPNSDPSN
jgi:hypothetical protein